MGCESALKVGSRFAPGAIHREGYAGRSFRRKPSVSSHCFAPPSRRAASPIRPSRCVRSSGRGFWEGQALPWNSHVRFLIRDRDGVYGQAFRSRARGFGLRPVVTARASPWQNGYCERVIGTLRRECLDQVIAVNERQVQRVLDEYRRYYNRTRTHLSLKKDAPDGRIVALPSLGRIVSTPEVGGLHHRYDRVAA
jgi:hypothetical protein